MAAIVTIFGALLQLAVASFVLLALASLAVLATREPARRVRIIELTLGALLVIPWLPLMPGYPQWSVLPPLALGTMGLPTEVAPKDVTPEPKHRIETGLASAAIVEPFVDVPLEAPKAAESHIEAPRAADRPVAVSPRSSKLEPFDESAVLDLTSRRATDYRFWVVTVYTCGVIGLLTWSLLGLAAVWRLMRTTRPADETCRALLREIGGPATDLVALRVSSRVGQPLAVAWWPSTIVLPAMLAEQGGTQQLRGAAHEWSHMARRDVWTWLLSGLLRCLYFYQPLLWWLRRQLRVSQDYVADYQAARCGNFPEDYAEFLATLSASNAWPPLAAGLGIGGRTSDLQRRVVMLVENRRPLEVTSPRAWNLIALVVSALTLAGVAALRAESRSSDEPSAVPARTALINDVEEVEVEPEVVADEAPRRATPKKKPAKPRLVRPGDVLVIEVEPNVERAEAVQPPMSPKLPSIKMKILLRPETRVTVNEAGHILLGSGYSTIYVDGKTLSEVQDAVADLLCYNQPSGIPVQLVRLHVNVRVEFAEQSQPTWRLSSNRETETYETSSRPATSQSGQIKPGDILTIEVGGAPEEAPVRPRVTVEATGTIPLGAHHGRVKVADKTIEEAEQIVRDKLSETIREPNVQVTFDDSAQSQIEALKKELERYSDEAHRKGVELQKVGNELGAMKTEQRKREVKPLKGQGQPQGPIYGQPTSLPEKKPTK